LWGPYMRRHKHRSSASCLCTLQSKAILRKRQPLLTIQLLTIQQSRACQVEDWPVHKGLCGGREGAPGQPSAIDEKVLKWDTKWRQYVIPYAVALVLQGAAIQPAEEIQQAQWDTIWKEYLCEIILIAEDYEHPTKGKKIRFKFLHAQKKKAKDALGEVRSDEYRRILSARQWGVGCAYLVFGVEEMVARCLVSRVNSLDSSQIRSPERMGRVDEKRKLVFQHVPCVSR